jgi:hypothetical protein
MVGPADLLQEVEPRIAFLLLVTVDVKVKVEAFTHQESVVEQHLLQFGFRNDQGLENSLEFCLGKTATRKRGKDEWKKER